MHAATSRLVLLLDRLFNGIALSVGCSVILTVLVVSYGVLAREVFKLSDTWVTDVTTYLMGYMTFVGTANAVRMTGADVMLADVGHDDGLMNSDTFLAAIDRAAGKRLRAALPVHLNGRLCDIGGLRVIADRHGISLIEDA